MSERTTAPEGRVIPIGIHPVVPSTGAERVCEEMQDAGFLICLIAHPNLPENGYGLAFERYLAGAMTSDAIHLIESISMCFRTDPEFFEDMVNHLHSMGAVYKND
ncbi:hypothetical protein LUX29_21450 [Aureimonas altamirensis]|uniref:hypothetical protein n=1 Tax=Aureimonas altamirensis TaxID=370622 RepID=UPI001E4910AA|nr:hypothetical protein [Aureimonas altamirensis]UHD45521.1 hypothetical protein LUX29_21450 [Aureimonas altamirensis]